MLRPYLGDIGHFSVILAFVSAILAAYSFFKASNSSEGPWLKTAKLFFAFHGLSIFVVIYALFSIIFNHYFEYHYAWDNSSLSLPLGYAISCFWQDQEGSFLLWMFWNVIVGFGLLLYFRKKKTDFQSPIMTIFSLVQAFLTSMILGVVLWGEFKLGSSPFLLLKESMPFLPVWATQPDFIPKDGNGLNPLLQNYWMVIHPPTLFLGFALSLVPFSFAIASLWKKNYQKWVRPTFPWMLLATLILGTGTLMGAIWAYETLSFGGYWTWDPVENAVYIPWLIMVAGFHTMLISHKSSTALKFTYILSILQFILILYSTFLTRSGILGESSVHSFTDLGLSGQLLIYLLFFLFMAIALLAFRWKELPKDEKEADTYSSEFWIFIGALVICLAGLQVIITTSIPVYNAIAKAFNYPLNMALPTDQIMHYTQFQMWLFIPILILTGIAQYFYWKKAKNFSALTNPLIITLLITALVIQFTKVYQWQYIILLTAGLFAITANAAILIDLFKTGFKVVGGAVTHIGVALMLIGIMYSSAFEKIVSENRSGSKIFEDGEQENKENIVLNLDNPYQLKDFEVNYQGKFLDVREVPGYIEKRFIKPDLATTYKGIALADIIDGDKTYYNRNDTVEYEAENTYYQLSFRNAEKDTFNLYPRFQVNQQMGNVASPDIKSFWNKDIYAHANYVLLDEEKEWTVPEEYTVMLKDTFFLNDYVAILDQVTGVNEVDGMPLKEGDAAAMATVRILEKNGQRTLSPLFVIKDKEIWSKPVVSQELGVRMQLVKIDPISGQFSFSVARTQRDFIVVKIIEKPFISLLWIGSALLVIGMLISVFRRFQIA